MSANYHTHTIRCMHASGSEEEYIRAAAQAGFSVLGFSDHSPWPFRGGYVSRCRMAMDQFPGYVDTLTALRAAWAGRVKLYIGLEAEYFPGYMGRLIELQQQYALDYLILGNHFARSEEDGYYFGRCTTPRQIREYADLTIQGMQSGLFCCLAHPDLFLNQYPAFDAETEAVCHALCEAAAELDLPLEYNLLGRLRSQAPHTGLGYTTDYFWQIAADYPVKAVIGYDAHDPQLLYCAAEAALAREQLAELGIPVLDTLPGLA